MFRTIVDTLKEVFWIKPSPKKSKPAARKKVSPNRKLKTPKKKTAKPAAKAVKKPPQHPVLKKTSTPGVGVVKKPVIDPSLIQVGAITHYFDRIKVCVVQVTQGAVLIGDKLTILGPKTKFVQKVWSMQIESEDVKVAKKGRIIGIKVDKIVAVGDKVYK